MKLGLASGAHAPLPAAEEALPPAYAELVAERRALEHHREVLLAELADVDRQLGRLGPAAHTDAAVRYIERHPGATTAQVVAASGVHATGLPRLAREGRIRNGTRSGGQPDKPARWYPGPREKDRER